jgi:phosphoglycerate dehydrogenase-like enzyme
VTLSLLVAAPRSELTEALTAALREQVPEVEIVLAETPADAQLLVPGIRAAFGTIEPEALAVADRLKWVQCPFAAPPAGYFYPELVEHPVVVTNMRGIFSDRISMHILAYLLAFARGLPTYLRRQFEHEWVGTDRAPVVEPGDATVLIVGVGGVGAETARLCAGLGMHVVGIDPRLRHAPEGMAEVHGPERLDDCLPHADFVVVTVPHTPRTEGLFDATRFARMKPTCCFVNIGRGATTVLADLDTALRTGSIGGAALDVFEVEPLPADHPLWTAPNVMITPHVAAAGPSLHPRRVELFVDNVRRFIAGRPLRNVVDKAEWH